MDGAVTLVLMLLETAVMVACHQVCFIGSEYSQQAGTPHPWFLPYGDPCQCTAILLGGMQVTTSSYQQGAPYYLDELFLSEDPDEIREHFNCSDTSGEASACLNPVALGMEDGTITDDRISASSSQFTAAEARLNCDGAWQPRSSDAMHWIAVEVGAGTTVTGIITQGYIPYHVESFSVVYKKLASSDFEYVTDRNGNVKVFEGNSDANTPVTNMFDKGVVAALIGIKPITDRNEGVALRLELLGCRSATIQLSQDRDHLEDFIRGLIGLLG